MGRSKMSSLAVRLPLAICLLLCLIQRIDAKPSPKQYLIETKDKGSNPGRDYDYAQPGYKDYSGRKGSDYNGDAKDYKKGDGDDYCVGLILSAVCSVAGAIIG